MSNKIDLTGQRFGRLVVVEESQKTSFGNKMSICKCDCGKKVEIKNNHLLGGNTKSCGCLRRYVGSNNSAEKAHKWANKFDNKEGTKLSTLTSKLSSANTSGFKGVSWHKGSNKWEAFIRIKKRRIYLGRFANKQDAIKARKQAEEKYFEPILEKYGKESK